jgi:DNA-nicking Smr family endonuclease
MSRRRSLSDEERALWTGIARSITPLRAPRASAEPAAAEEVADETASASPPPATRHDGLPGKKAPPLAPLGRRLKQRVARGRESIDARLDLHGLTQRDAYVELLRFLRRAQADGARMALVVTGKGVPRGEQGATAERGVLKRQVPLWLSLPEFRPLVLGFDDAHAGHGGQGALYVRLRRLR